MSIALIALLGSPRRSDKGNPIMAAILFALAKQFWKPLAVIFGMAVLAASFWFWLAAHDRAVLHGYVLLSEKQASNAQARESKRQADAAAQSLKTINDTVTRDKAADAIHDAAREKEITDYEAQLIAAKRACALDDADVRVIVHNGSAKALDSRHH